MIRGEVKRLNVLPGVQEGDTISMHLNDLRNCLDRRFQLDDDRYTWTSTVGKFAVTVVPWQTSAQTDCVRVSVTDCITDLELDEWTHSVRCTDN
jgi:hypothetical protein